MNKKQIEEHINEAYPKFNDALIEIGKKLEKGLDFYRENKYEQIEKGDFRPGTISRLMSSIVSNRFLINMTLNFIKDKN
jgi:hypothetical protein